MRTYNLQGIRRTHITQRDGKLAELRRLLHLSYMRESLKKLSVCEHLHTVSVRSPAYTAIDTAGDRWHELYASGYFGTL